MFGAIKFSLTAELTVEIAQVWPYTYSQCPSNPLEEANQDPRKQQRINECPTTSDGMVFKNSCDRKYMGVSLNGGIPKRPQNDHF